MADETNQTPVESPTAPAAAAPIDTAAIEAKARAETLKKLGYDSWSAAEKDMKARKEAEQARMTEQEKIAARLKELESYEGQAKEYAKTIAEIASAQMGKLSDDKRAVVIKYAGEDPQSQLRYLNFLQEAQDRPESRQDGAAASTVAIRPPPATTTTPAKPPAPAGPTNKYQEWQALKAKDPLGATIFYNNFQREILASAPAS